MFVCEVVVCVRSMKYSKSEWKTRIGNWDEIQVHQINIVMIDGPRINQSKHRYEFVYYLFMLFYVILF